MTITGNDIVGAADCATVAAQRATNLTIGNNTLVGYANLVDRAGNFVPMGVVDVRERPVAQQTCATGTNCYFVYYPDHLTVNGT